MKLPFSSKLIPNCVIRNLQESFVTIYIKRISSHIKTELYMYTYAVTSEGMKVHGDGTDY